MVWCRGCKHYSQLRETQTNVKKNQHTNQTKNIHVEWGYNELTYTHKKGDDKKNIHSSISRSIIWFGVFL